MYDNGNFFNGDSKMKKVLLALLGALVFIGCSSKGAEELAPSKLAVGASLESLTLNDQFEKPHAVTKETRKIVFAFSKQVGHDCNDFFATKESDYLSSKNTLFVADVSGAPSVIRSMFIMPGLKDFAHTILVIDDKNVAATYKPEGDLEKVVVVSLDSFVITSIDYLQTPQELDTFLTK